MQCLLSAPQIYSCSVHTTCNQTAPYMHWNLLTYILHPHLAESLASLSAASVLSLPSSSSFSAATRRQTPLGKEAPNGALQWKSDVYQSGKASLIAQHSAVCWQYRHTHTHLLHSWISGLYTSTASGYGTYGRLAAVTPVCVCF